MLVQWNSIKVCPFDISKYNLWVQIHFKVRVRFGVLVKHRVRIRPKMKFLFSGATVHIPLTKPATLNRLLHCVLWEYAGALSLFLRALFCISGAKSPGAPGPCNFFPG